MASSKDTFQPLTFLADVFACGAFRGTGVSAYAAVSERLTLLGTDDARLTLLGTDDTRLTLEGTDDTRLTLEGV